MLILQPQFTFFLMEIMLKTNLKAGKNTNFEMTSCFQVAELQLGFVSNPMEKMCHFPWDRV